jgi:spore germination protein YaaH
VAASAGASPAPGASASPTPRPTVAAPSLTPGPPRQRALAATEVFGFLPSWELDAAGTIDLDQVTTLAWFGLEAGARGTLIREVDGVATPGWAGWTSATWTALRDRAQAAGVRVVLTVQRFSWTDGQRRRTIRLLSDPGARIRLVADIMAVITEAGVDGVNLDVEPLPREVSADFTQLVRELRAAMNAVDPSLQLTFDVMPGIEGYDIAALTADDAADAMFVMGYEYVTGSAARTGSTAPLVDPDGPDLTSSIETIVSLVPPDRVILGLPWYGRAWSTVTDEPRSDTRSGARYPSSVTVFYRDAIEQATRTGRLYDPLEASAWTVYPSKVADCAACRVTWRQLWYDDVDATRTKVEFAQEEGLRGVGFWALGYQGAGDEMWSVLRLTLDGARDRAVPSGTATIDPAFVAGQRGALDVVGRRVRLLLTSEDARDGSGVAFVRVGVTPGVDETGQLREGTTFPAAEAITFDVVTGGPVYDLPSPRARPTPTAAPSPSAAADVSPPPSASPGTAGPTGSTAPSAAPSVPPSGGAVPSPGASPSPGPQEPSPGPTPATDPGRRVIRVQWRDVAGNWSEPLSIPVWYRPSARPGPSPVPSAEPTPSSAPPFVPGESPAVDDLEDPEDPAASPSPGAPAPSG